MYASMLHSKLYTENQLQDVFTKISINRPGDMKSIRSFATNEKNSILTTMQQTNLKTAGKLISALVHFFTDKNTIKAFKHALLDQIKILNKKCNTKRNECV